MSPHIRGFIILTTMALLVLVRHGKSEWNHLGLWTGLVDVDLTHEGVAEARKTGSLLSDIPFHALHVSELYRAQRTLMEVIEATGKPHYHEAESHPALNERDYGDLTGKNKWQVKDEVGEERFNRIRRHFDEPVPNGETLKDVYHRVVPYYEQRILPKLAEGKNVLVVAHGNSLRALAKHLEKIADEDVAHLEIGTGEAHCYTIDATGTITAKEIRGANTQKGKV